MRGGCQGKHRWNCILCWYVVVVVNIKLKMPCARTNVLTIFVDGYTVGHGLNATTGYLNHTES